VAEVALTQVTKTYDQTPVLSELSLHIPDGEFCVILGPSGCGKSTLLRLVAGLETVDSGQIHIGGTDVTNTPPNKRAVGMVFQNYALYPHMTVAENIGLPLRLRKEETAKITSRVHEVANMLGLAELLERRPRQLSGGQRQRVALGRAIAQRPRVYLLDEPLSNVDALLRVRMRNELSHLWQTLGTTVIYVTHDQSEALSLGTKVCVLHEGRVQQAGSPGEIYDRPHNRFVAGFVGSPPINLVRGRLRAEKTYFFDPWQMPLPMELPLDVRALKGQEVTVGVRPENVVALVDPERTFTIKGEAERIEYQGAVTWVTCRVAGQSLVARAKEGADIRVGRVCHLQVDRDRLHWFNQETGIRV
jgi:multiple sugar transport system ATP-binding protein